MSTATQMLEQFQTHYFLEDNVMDTTHREFLQLVEKTASAPKESFAILFRELFEHTKLHFADEETRMETISHSALKEHHADHQRILGDMDRLCQRAEAGRITMARAWVNDSLLAWFDTHAKTMDSALAADFKRKVKD